MHSYVEVLESCVNYVEDARAFGLDFIHVKEETPNDTVSLTYNWNVWNAKAFSLISGKKGTLHKHEANKVFDAIVRFLVKKLIDFSTFEGSRTTILSCQRRC